MPSRRLLWLPLLTVAAMALVAAACGDNEENTGATPTGAATVAASPTPPGVSPTAEATSNTASTPEAAPNVIDISAVPPLRFDRDSIEVEAGSEVTLRFINEDSGVPHNWAAYTDSSATELIPGAITEVCSGPCEEEITFTAPSEAGEYFFRCDVHPTTMTGTLVVK